MFEQGIQTTVSLDVGTLFVVATCITALLGLFLLFAWTQDRIRALAWWGAAYLIGGFSVALWTVNLNGLVPSSLPSALLFLACGMIWSAARLFHGRRVMWTALLIGPAIWMAACALPSFAQMSVNRIVLASLIVATYIVLAAAELWRERRKSLIRRWPALFVPALHGAVFLFPIPLAGLLPEERGIVTLAAGWIAVFVLEMLLYAVGTAFILLTLTKERTLRMHKTAALTDPLTGLYNRRGLIEASAELTGRTGRAAKSVAVLMFDLDYFKGINDRFGHAVGDEVLKLFASVVGTKLRATDFVARLGGEEFAAIIPGTVEEGVIVAERIRVAFETAARTVAGHYLGATISVGVAAREPGGSVDAALAQADGALYAAKANGRNRVETADGRRADDIIAPPLAPDAGDIAGTDDEIVWTAYRRPRLVSVQGRAAA